MKILIDMQGAQSTGSRNRGIGRYTQSLVRSLILNKEAGDDIILLFSSAFWECIPNVIQEMDVDLSPEQIKIWHCNSSVSALDGNAVAREVGELSREAYIATLSPDVVLVTSLFEGSGDDVVISVGRFISHVPTVVVLYDLIPYLNRSIYLSDLRIEAWYERKLQELRKADVLLAISEASRQDALSSLGVSGDEVVNISSAVEGFSKQKIDSNIETLLRNKYAISGSFVLYTGGIDHRKNIEGLIEAFATLSREILHKTQLVIVCSVHQFIRERLLALASRLGLPANSIVLTGFVPEDDLVRLYNLCDLFVFPSLYEGFGLPVLEAMHCGAVVVGANTSSIPEVIGFSQALFDPSNKEAIADKIVEGLTDEAFRQAFKAHAVEQVKLFTWEESGRRTLAALRNALDVRSPTIPCAQRYDTGRPRLAYLSPLPPMKSGIADFSAELLPELARWYDIDLVVNGSIDFPWANAAARVVSVEYFRANANQYDRILYHFGNSDFHSHMFDLLAEQPGVVVLHDFFLSGIHDYMQSRDLRRNSLTREMYESHSYAGLHALKTEAIDCLVRKYPCNFSVLSNALGIITHSEFSKALGEHFFGGGVPSIWETAPLARMVSRPCSRGLAREKLGLANEELLICSFGIVFPTKLNHRLLDAWDRLQASNSQRINLVFVGETSGAYGIGIEEEFSRERQNGSGKITGWASQETYRDYLAAADIAVQLRGISRGETSASVLDCMAAGLPTVVNANGSMAELPSDCVLMISDEFSDEELLEALEKLVQSAELRDVLGRRGRQHIRNHHLPRQVASRYREIIEAAYASPLNMPHRLGRAMARHAPGLTKPDLLSLVQASARNFRPMGWQRQVIVHLPDQPDAAWSDRLKEALKIFFRGYRVEPVEVTLDGDVYYARCRTLALLGLDPGLVADEPVDLYEGDLIFTDKPDSAVKVAIVTTPGMAVRPLGDLFEFLSALDRVEFG